MDFRWKVVFILTCFIRGIHSSAEGIMYTFVDGSTAVIHFRHTLDREVYMWSLQGTTSDEPFYIYHVADRMAKTNYDFHPDQRDRFKVTGTIVDNVLNVTWQIAQVSYPDSGDFVLNVIYIGLTLDPMPVDMVTINIIPTALLTPDIQLCHLTNRNIHFGEKRALSCKLEYYFQINSGLFSCNYYPSGINFLHLPFQNKFVFIMMVSVDFQIRCCIQIPDHDPMCQCYMIENKGALNFQGKCNEIAPGVHKKTESSLLPVHRDAKTSGPNNEIFPNIPAPKIVENNEHKSGAQIFMILIGLFCFLFLVVLHRKILALIKRTVKVFRRSRTVQLI